MASGIRLTAEEFIAEAKRVHGNKYDYSKVEYVNARVKVCVICPEHGEFWQLPYAHTKGSGCPKCAGKGKTFEDFLSKAREVHGNKYDYSKVEYVNTNTKVCIICPEHGEFWQDPTHHLHSGCPKCSGRNRTTEDFIAEAKKIHGNKYDYSKVEYSRGHSKVCIICPEHGEFWQTPSEHLQGRGCPKCGRQSTAGSLRTTTEDFISKARKVHGNKYDYSKVVYVNMSTKVCIICPEHGEFWQIPSNHLKGFGCEKCSSEKKAAEKAEEFIAKSREIHGDKYDYSKVEYKCSNKKVCIICPEHGEFWQTPSQHLKGFGCRKCAYKTVKNETRKTAEQFIAEARGVHGDKYDYSKVEYVNNKTKICIICPEHGEFWQNPKSHLNGIGCPKCHAPNRGITTEEFIVKSREIYGDRYDYSKVVYKKMFEKVCIICPEHGEFWQTPLSHLEGSGCPKCSGRNRTTEDFIAEARKIHGDKYDYSKTEYKGVDEKVCIICPEHGEFWQNAYNHIHGFGCQSCANSLRHIWVSENNLFETVKNYFNNITVIQHGKPVWLGRQHFDIWIPDYNIAIEYQGDQHYFPVKYFGGIEVFERTVERDKRKKLLCEKHGCNLIEVNKNTDINVVIEKVKEYMNAA